MQNGPAPDEILLIVLEQRRFGISPLILADLFKRGLFHGGEHTFFFVAGHIAGAPHIPDAVDGLPFFQPPGDLHDLVFPHAVDQQVGSAIHQNGAADFIIPIIVVGEPAQGCLDAADDDGQVGPGPLDQVGIDDHCPVGPAPRQTAGGVGVLFPPALCHGVMGHHGIDVARIDQGGIAGPAHGQQLVGRVVIGLGKDGHPEPGFFQHTGDHRCAKGGVIHIGIAGDQQEIVVIPTPLHHIFF